MLWKQECASFPLSSHIFSNSTHDLLHFLRVINQTWFFLILIHCFFTDINECKNVTDPCHANATCNNTHGSYICDCHKGYDGDGKKCVGMYLFPLLWLSPQEVKITNILIYFLSWFCGSCYNLI